MICADNPAFCAAPIADTPIINDPIRVIPMRITAAVLATNFGTCPLIMKPPPENTPSVRISDEFVHPFRSNPYTRFGVFVHPVKECSQLLA
jgi:hypothetical protein